MTTASTTFLKRELTLDHTRSVESLSISSHVTFRKRLNMCITPHCHHCDSIIFKIENKESYLIYTQQTYQKIKKKRFVTCTFF